MCIGLRVPKIVTALTAMLILTIMLTVPVFAESSEIPQPPATEQTELPVVSSPDEAQPPETPTESNEQEQAPPEDTPSDQEQESLPLQSNNTTNQPQDATASMLECLQDIRTCMTLLVYVIFPVIAAVLLIKWFVVRTFSNYVS